MAQVYEVHDAAGDPAATITVGEHGDAAFTTDTGVTDTFRTLAECVARIHAVGGSVPDLDP